MGHLLPRAALWQERVSCPLEKPVRLPVGVSFASQRTRRSKKLGSSKKNEKTDKHHTLCNTWCCAFCLVFRSIFLGTRYLVFAAAGQRQRKKSINLKKGNKTTARSHPTTCRKRVAWKYICRPAPCVRFLGVFLFVLALVFRWHCGSTQRGRSRLVANISMIPRMWHGTVENEASEIPLPKPIES